MFILGASTLGVMIADAVIRSGGTIEGFFDDVSTAQAFGGFPVLGKSVHLVLHPAVKKNGIFVAIGDNQNRRLCFMGIRDMGIPLPNVIDSRAVVEPSASLGDGNLIMAGAYVGARTSLGSGNLVFPGVSITHHNRVGDFCFFSPNSAVGGYAEIGNECKIGMNAVVLPYVRVAERTEAAVLTIVSGPRREWHGPPDAASTPRSDKTGSA